MPIKSTKKFGLFDENHKLIKYFPSTTPIKLLNAETIFMPGMADIPYVKVRVDKHDGYIRKSIAEEARS